MYAFPVGGPRIAWAMVSSSLSLKSKKHPCRCPLRRLLVNSRYEKAPHRCDAAWSQEHIVSLWYYYDRISKEHENFPTRPKRKNMTKAFSPNTPLHILEKNRWLCGTVLGRESKIIFQTAPERCCWRNPLQSEHNAKVGGRSFMPRQSLYFKGFFLSNG